ncbi:hypothetical protein GOV10_04080, partial [Candidatus Woesearchaeota archaeon]|nr:hypothetical protein [Candidatus Woesearchaeota archaeon]
FITFPIQLTFSSWNRGEMGFIGAAFLVLGGIALYFFVKKYYSKKFSSFARAAFVFIAVNLVVFFFLLHEMRYIVFLFPLLALLAVSVFSVEFEPRWLTYLLVIFLLGSILLNSAFTLAYNGKSLPVALGFESQDYYLTRNVGNYETFSWANKNLPPDAHILTNDAWSYYLERTHYWSSQNRQSLFDYSELTTVDLFSEKLRAYDITHVIFRTDRTEDLEKEFLESCPRVYDSELWVVCAVE